MEIQPGCDHYLNLWGADLLPVVKAQLNWGQESLCLQPLPDTPDTSRIPWASHPGWQELPAAPQQHPHPPWGHTPHWGPVWNRFKNWNEPFPMNLTSSGMRLIRGSKVDKKSRNQQTMGTKPISAHQTNEHKLLRGQDTDFSSKSLL